MAPRGNPNPTGSKPDKLMRDALILALNREAKDANGKATKKLNLIAARLVENAIGGETQAIREIFDRVDGKPAQAITGPNGGPIETYDAVALAKLSQDEIKQLIALRNKLAAAVGPGGGA